MNNFFTVKEKVKILQRRKELLGWKGFKFILFLSDRQRVKIYTEGKEFINFSEGKGLNNQFCTGKPML